MDASTRLLQARGVWKGGEVELPQSEGVVSTGADLAVRESLKKHIALNTCENSVNETVYFIGAFLHVPVVVDAGSADELSKAKTCFYADDLPSESVLGLLAKMYGFLYGIQNGKIVVFSKSAYMGSNLSQRCEKSAWTSLGKNDRGVEEFRHGPTGIVFVRIPAGEFMMGDSWPPPSRTADSPPNPFGVQGLGLRWEWCQSPREQADSQHPHSTDCWSVLRGGSWLDTRPSALRCGARVVHLPEDSLSPLVGFRVAAECPQPAPPALDRPHRRCQVDRHRRGRARPAKRWH